MCLGVPGRVTRVEPNTLGVLMGTVDFGGVRKEVCLDYLPDVQVGEYVIVHVGFAISKVDEAEAKQVFEFLGTMGELKEFEPPGVAAADATPPSPASRGTPRPADP